jgi:hypothetical protein
MIPYLFRGVAILVPVVQDAGFTFIAPQNAGYVVGQVFASNSPTSWAIIADSSDVFLTDSNGVNLTDSQGNPLTVN